ncbi:UBC6 [Symbiodinium natans]|uniref:UBC6 protein n=1 Tax=Symbiodinium natans TaxID=878477 RepID=A0A812MB48_9DINO|nr:UBC6 [Symbiodinium natans]
MPEAARESFHRVRTQFAMSSAPLSQAARRRILADLKTLQEEPIPLAAAAPCSDADLSLWNGVIGTQMEVTHLGCVTVPLHFLIDFPCDYPLSAPNIGFSFEFQYRGGASYVQPDGRLKGKLVICLDVLGNFGHVHTEWKSTVGSGWSPAYTVTTLMIQLQSVLCDLGTQMTQQERDKTYQSAVRFCEKNPRAVLPILDEDEIYELRRKQQVQQQLRRICRGDDALVERVSKIARRAGLVEREGQLDSFLELLSDVASTASGSCSASETESVAKIDKNICCWSTGKLYTEALLGVGVSRERKNLGTAGELLSKEAFDGGLRQNTNKSPFEFFLPVWINEAHAAGSTQWREELRKQVLQIGRSVFEAGNEDAAAMEVFPRLINQMIVEMMRPDSDKSAAIATFEALCNFWRTFRWLVDTREGLRNKVANTLTRFVKEESFRHKDHSPDLGALLVLFTVMQGYPACPARDDFISTYADENSLRWVMWWQRSGTPPDGGAVFQATKVSREILMFQMAVVDIVIGDVAKTLSDMEETNCKLPERLEHLQAEWRKRKESVGDWTAYYNCIGAARPSFPSTGEWIASCVRRAAAEKGPKYGSGGGKGEKGKGKGKGKGKF